MRFRHVTATGIRPGNPHAEWTPLIMGVESGESAMQTVTRGDVELMRVIVDTLRQCGTSGSGDGRRSHNRRAAGRPGFKMTIEKAREVRRLYAEGGWSHRSLGAVFGIAGNGVKRILHNETWREKI